MASLGSVSDHSLFLSNCFRDNLIEASSMLSFSMSLDLEISEKPQVLSSSSTVISLNGSELSIDGISNLTDRCSCGTAALAVQTVLVGPWGFSIGWVDPIEPNHFLILDRRHLALIPAQV